MAVKRIIRQLFVYFQVSRQKTEWIRQIALPRLRGPDRALNRISPRKRAVQQGGEGGLGYEMPRFACRYSSGRQLVSRG